MGEILRRLTSKCAARATSERAARLLSPLQLGVGIRGGCEAIVHAVRELVEKMQDNEDPEMEDFIFQADLRNAYNNADRQCAFAEVREHFPDLARWVESCYGQESFLTFGDKVINSSQGFHQGDPLASLLFALTFHPVILKIKEEVPDLSINVWFQDNGVLAGKGQDIRKATQILKDKGMPRGLILSTRETVRPEERPKSILWSPGHHELQDPLGLSSSGPQSVRPSSRLSG